MHRRRHARPAEAAQHVVPLAAAVDGAVDDEAEAGAVHVDVRAAGGRPALRPHE